MKNFYKNSIIALSLLAALSAHALDTKVAELSIAAKPAFPQPGQNFTVEAKSFSFDASAANFRWTLNGKALASGAGQTSVNLIAGAVGSVMKIDVSATSPAGQTFSKSITINIAGVDLVANPFTYAPALYRGSPLASANSAVEVYAVPQLYSGGARLSGDSLVYEWTLNDQKTGSQSGAGKNKFIFSIPDAGGFVSSIKLKVSNISGSVAAEKSITIRTVEPQMLFYQTNPLTGRSVEIGISFGVTGRENISIRAEPYFFSLNSLACFCFLLKSSTLPLTSRNLCSPV